MTFEGIFSLQPTIFLPSVFFWAKCTISGSRLTPYPAPLGKPFQSPICRVHAVGLLVQSPFTILLALKFENSFILCRQKISVSCRNQSKMLRLRLLNCSNRHSHKKQHYALVVREYLKNGAS